MEAVDVRAVAEAVGEADVVARAAGGVVTGAVGGGGAEAGGVEGLGPGSVVGVGRVVALDFWGGVRGGCEGEGEEGEKGEEEEAGEGGGHGVGLGELRRLELLEVVVLGRRLGTEEVKRRLGCCLAGHW